MYPRSSLRMEIIFQTITIAGLHGGTLILDLTLPEVYGVHGVPSQLSSSWTNQTTASLDYIWNLQQRHRCPFPLLTDSMLDLYSHYKFYHFFSICFGLGCGLCSYRPYYSLVMPVILTGFSMFAFEAVGWSIGLPPHSKRCKGPPFHWRDALWGFIFALLVAVLHLRSHHVYTLSYGSGIVMFSIRGAKRRYSTLRNHWNTDHTSFTGTNRTRGHASYTGTNRTRGHASYTGGNWNRGHASYTGGNWNRGHASYTRTGSSTGGS